MFGLVRLKRLAWALPPIRWLWIKLHTLFRRAFGTTLAGQHALKPKGQVQATAWPGVGSDGFVFPELRPDDEILPTLHEKPSFGICLSGGGTRSASCCLGWMRALRQHGLLSKARFISSNSGGTWFNVAFSFQDKVSTDDFLGEPVPAAELTVDRAQATADAPGCYNAVTRDSDGIFQGYFTTVLYQAVSLSHEEVRAYARDVGTIFLANYELQSPHSAFALAGQNHEQTLMKLRQLGIEATVHTACREAAEMPFPIIVSCVVVPKPGEERSPGWRPFLPLEWTPLYMGVPIDIQVAPDAAKLGSVLMEPIIACSDPPAEPPADWEAEVAVKKTVSVSSDHVVSLTQVAGMSSDIMAAVLFDSSFFYKIWKGLGLPKLNTWGSNLQGGSWGCCDGALHDNLAIFPQLRRGVKSLLICYSTDASPLENEAMSAAGIPSPQSYFGRVSASNSHFAWGEAKLWNESCQVFESKEWDNILAQLKQTKTAGGAAFATATLKVLPNKFAGVQGGYKVKTVWLINEGVDEWQRVLPDDSRKVVGTFLGKGFFKDNFPYLAHWQPQSSNPFCPEPNLLTTYLSHLAYWNMTQIVDHVKALIDDSD